MHEITESGSRRSASKGGRSGMRRAGSGSRLGRGGEVGGKPQRPRRASLPEPIAIVPPWDKGTFLRRSGVNGELVSPPARAPLRPFLDRPSNGVRPARKAPPFAALLQWLYGRVGLPLPRLDQLKGTGIPQPYRSLLVHSSDMTPTLEKFYHRPLRVTVFRTDLQGEWYLREVVLKLVNEMRLVEYGVIRIHLDRLPPTARRQVLAGHYPLGHILQRGAIPHLSWPQAFFRVEADAHIQAMLCLRTPRVLYGRRNVLLTGGRRLLAEVIEILAPVVQPLPTT